MAEWCVDPVNGDSSYTGETWNLLLSGTDGRTYGTTKLTSETGGFTGMEGRFIRVGSSMKRIVAVVSDTEVTMDATHASGTGRSFWIGGAVVSPSNIGSTASAGDLFKFAKSPDSVSVGDLTYALKEAQVGFAAGRIKRIDACTAGWATAANVAATYQRSIAVSGTNALRLAVASAFTTGKLAHKDLGEGNELDLSSFQGVSLYLQIGNNGSPLAAGTIELCLCSDANGDIVVDTLEIQPLALHKDSNGVASYALKTGGGNLGASIRSIALYAATDPATAYIYVADIVAVKSQTDAGHICHSCLLSQAKTGEPWWSIAYFDSDTTLQLTGQFYGGTAGEVASYRRHGALWPLGANSFTSIANTEDNPSIFKGGYNPATDECDGETAVQLWSATNATEPVALNSDFTRLENFVFHGFIAAQRYLRGVGLQDVVLAHHMGKSTSSAQAISSSSNLTAWATADKWRFARVTATGFPGYFVSTPAAATYDSYRGLHQAWHWEDVRIYSCRGVSLSGILRWVMRDAEICNSHQGSSPRGLIIAGGAHDSEFYNLKLNDSGNYGLSCDHLVTGLRFYNLEAKGNADGWLRMGHGEISFLNPDVSGDMALRAATCDHRVHLMSRVGDAEDSLIMSDLGTIVSDAVTRHTASGISWKLSPTNAANMRLPLKVGTIAVKAGVPTTIGLWMRRSSLDVGGRLFVRGGQVSGVSDDLESVISAAADMWQLCTVELTATASGYVEVWAEAWGGTEHSVWVDDLSVVV